MIVMAASKERKKQEEQVNKPGMKDKLSQTGWKIRHNFIKQTNNYLEDKDRIDVFGGSDQPQMESQGGSNKIGSSTDGTSKGYSNMYATQGSESDSDECMILEYGA